MESFKIRLKGERKHYFEDIQRPVTRFLRVTLISIDGTFKTLVSSDC